MNSAFLQNKYIAPVLLTIAIALGGYALLSLVAGSFLTEMTQEVHIDVSTSSAATLRENAPTFALPTLSGKSVSLEENSGGPLIVIFWTSWNSASTDQLAIFDKIALERYPGLHLVAINVQEERSVVSSFMSRSGYHIETLLDETGKVASNYRAFSLPAVYFIDKSGTIQSIALGVLSEQMVLREIESIID